MRKVVISLLGMCVLLVSGCSGNNEPLVGTYIGYLVPGDENHHVLLVFDKSHPKQVGLREMKGIRVRNQLFYLSYDKHHRTFMFESNSGVVKYTISRDKRSLDCKRCENKRMPSHFNKLKGEKTAKRVFDDIERKVINNVPQRFY